MVRLILVLLLSGCTITTVYDADRRVETVSISPGIARPSIPDDGAVSVAGVGVVYARGIGVLGYYRIRAAQLGPCGVAVITDHPERVDPALTNNC